jgi:hypothetical protein
MAGLLLFPTGRETLYLDPGSGSFILQMLVAGAAGFLYIMRNQIARFFGIFRRKDKTESQKDKDENAE